ncbi:MAG: GMP synthase [Gammaproteobacteria bacterium]|nr:GMP synthase [Gammaproteobacteria bacterium]NNJ96998.1 GMP synthase [Gammaproteobacteria bacterium]
MIIGIVEADQLDEEVLRQFGNYTDRFAELLCTADPRLQFRTYCALSQQYPEDIDACDAYLITGSKFSAYEEVAWIGHLKQFVRDCYAREKKLIGICFGHQLIAHALGGDVHKSEKGWGVGLIRSGITHSPAWMSPELDVFGLLFNHQDQVTRLPPDAALIATNDFCPVSSFQVDQSILTFQGHPEFSRDYLRYLIVNRRQDIGDTVYRQAIASLEQPVDHEQVAKWIVNFLRE